MEERMGAWSILIMPVQYDSFRPNHPAFEIYGSHCIIADIITLFLILIAAVSRDSFLSLRSTLESGLAA